MPGEDIKKEITELRERIVKLEVKVEELTKRKRTVQLLTETNE